MARTLLDVAQKTSVACRLNPSFTTFSYDDETQILVDFINQAVRYLRDSMPWVPFVEKRGTINLVAGTRLYDVAADCLAPEIFNWSYENQSNNYNSLEAVTLEWIKASYQLYQTAQGDRPQYVYTEDGQLGFYPIPNQSQTIGYIYPDYPNVLTTPSATFPYPDEWLDFIEFYAAVEYMDMKGMDAGRTFTKGEAAFARIYAKAWKSKPHYIQ
jgi:hypothetical protein